jgi:menaquinone-dependent protoporphyrinogen oxidase
MANKVLVAYGTRYGATGEIAKKIGDVLRKESIQTDVLSAGEVADPAQYRAFIIGSGVYIGMWRKDAVNFIMKNEKLLAGNPVWIFSSGPTGKGKVEDLMSGWKFPRKLGPAIERIKPRDITVFHGSADEKKLNFFFKFMLKNVKAPTGDFRDWDAITSWAKKIAGELKKK